MKRAAILGVCLVLGLSQAAFAFETTDAAYAGVIAAGRGLETQARNAMDGAAADVPAALTQFRRVAGQARDAMDALDGPHDLRCIFNGMADDAARRSQQLDAAADDAARRQALEDIAYLGVDAVLVTPEVEADNAMLAGLPPMECAASAAPVGAGALAALLSE